MTDSLPKAIYQACIVCGMLGGCSSEDQSTVTGSNNSIETSTNQLNDNDTGSGTSKSILTLDTSLFAYGFLASNGGSLALTKSEDTSPSVKIPWDFCSIVTAMGKSWHLTVPALTQVISSIPSTVPESPYAACMDPNSTRPERFTADRRIPISRPMRPLFPVTWSQ